jgi:hypothetical protein
VTKTSCSIIREGCGIDIYIAMEAELFALGFGLPENAESLQTKRVMCSRTSTYGGQKEVEDDRFIQI